MKDRCGSSCKYVIFRIYIRNYFPYFATPVSLSFKELVSRSMPLNLRPFDNVHVSFMPKAFDVLRLWAIRSLWASRLWFSTSSILPLRLNRFWQKMFAVRFLYLYDTLMMSVKMFRLSYSFPMKWYPLSIAAIIVQLPSQAVSPMLKLNDVRRWL